MVSALALVLQAGSAFADPAAPASYDSTARLHVDAFRDTVTVSASNARLDAVLEAIAREVGLELVLDGPTQARLTIELDQVSITEAAHRILRGRDFLLRYTRRDAGGASPAGTLWVFAGEAEDAALPGETPDAQAGIRGGEPADDQAPRAAAAEGSKSVEELSYLLAEADPRTRVEAVSGLTEVGGEGATAALLGALTDPDPWVRQEAAFALGTTGDPMAIQWLKHAVVDDDVHVREAAIEALAGTEGYESARALAPALHDAEPAVRAQAAQALGDIGGQAAVDLLGAAFDDEHPDVRLAAFIALNRIGGEAKVRALDRALQDPDPSVRSAVQQLREK